MLFCNVLLIVDKLEIDKLSPVTEGLSVAIQLKLLEGEAVKPKFNAVPEHTLPELVEMIGNGFNVIETVCGRPTQLVDVAVGVTV